MSSPTQPAASTGHSLSSYVAPEDIIPYRPIHESEWGALRRRALVDLLRGFCTWRNLRRYRGFFISDIVGFAWAGIYRSMLVPSIAATSFKNEGHFRPRERISGTERFFSGSFRYPRGAGILGRIIDEVNVRHHAAGVVARTGNTVVVQPQYEAAFAYVATAMIEGLRAGYVACGQSPESPKGRRIGEDLCTIIYQVAGMVGLPRVPRNLEAHERFRDAYEAHLKGLHRSRWMETQARELAKRILPYTAARTGVPMREHLERHLDRMTADYLFPNPSILHQVQPVYEEFQQRQKRQGQGYLRAFWAQLFPKSLAKEGIDAQELLWRAYRAAPDDSVEARILGAVLIHAIEVGPSGASWLTPVDLSLQPGESLLKQGENHPYCYIILEASTPLIVSRRGIPGMDPGVEIEIARVNAPNMLGEIGMWRGRPAIATVACAEPARLRVLRLDTPAFNALKAQSGFWNAVAAEVQKRLRVSMKHLEQSLRHSAVRIQDPELDGLLQLIAYINGDTTVQLDRIPGVHAEITLAECVDLLRQMASAVHDRHRQDPELQVHLGNLLDVIG